MEDPSLISNALNEVAPNYCHFSSRGSSGFFWPPWALDALTRARVPTTHELKNKSTKFFFLKSEWFYIKIRDYSSKCLETELISKQNLSVVNKSEQWLTYTRLLLNTRWLNEREQRRRVWKGKPSSQGRVWYIVKQDAYSTQLVLHINCLLNIEPHRTSWLP